MLAPYEHTQQGSEERQLIAEVSSGVSGPKDGRGIGNLVDGETIDLWLQDYLRSRSEPVDMDRPTVLAAFQFGVRSETRYAGKSFIEAEPEIRSEWSCERGRLPWETVRDPLWAGFDRARDRSV